MLRDHDFITREERAELIGSEDILIFLSRYMRPERVRFCEMERDIEIGDDRREFL